ncbi:serine hydrolase domain-containing protein [Actinoplanes sp. NPDC049596]|uniref:serine hydrolase domain-containing protein n=1 Tax=unclassified Actinoplanes TaxID=2626549 RepID=UPI003417C3B0
MLQRLLDGLVANGAVGALGELRNGGTTESGGARAACRREPEFAPGTSRAYNNTGYLLLGLEIERVTGHPYGEEITQRILRPLGLRRTLVRDDSELIPEPHAHAYLEVNGELVDITDYNPSTAGASGGMISTAGDVNAYFRGLLTGPLLAPEQRRTMLDGGFGITRYDVPGLGELWGKEGGFHGFRTWTLHRSDCEWQLTISATGASVPSTEEFLKLPAASR